MVSVASSFLTMRERPNGSLDDETDIRLPVSKLFGKLILSGEPPRNRTGNLLIKRPNFGSTHQRVCRSKEL